jgi:hypothetical protein
VLEYLDASLIDGVIQMMGDAHDPDLAGLHHQGLRELR